MKSFENRKLIYHIVAYDANNSSSLILGMSTFVIHTDIYAKGGKAIWGLGAYVKPEVRRHGIVVKIEKYMAEEGRKNPEVRIVRGRTAPTSKITKLNAAKMGKSSEIDKNLFYE